METKGTFRPRVVVGVTGTLANLAALHVAVRYARAWQRPLVAVLARPADGTDDADKLWCAFLCAFGGAPPDLDVELKVVTGSATAALLAQAHVPGDLLVVGESRRSRWQLGATVSARCLRRAGQVVVVPKPPLLQELGQVPHIRDLDGLAAL